MYCDQYFFMSEDLIESFDTQLQIRVSTKDKKFLKTYCIEVDKSISELIRDIIAELREGGNRED